MDTNPPQPTHESFEIVYLDPLSIRFAYDGENLTFTDRDGRFYPRVTLRRGFPSLFYFVPGIQRIVSIREEFGFLYWSVETDRGAKEFIMRDSVIGSVRKISEGRYLLIDINQTRYQVSDLDALDERSQALLRRYLLL
jgi:Domain of unknown function (DUF1854)